MLAVEVDQIVLELLMQESLAATPDRFRWRCSQVVFVVVNPDASLCRDSDLWDALSADSGFLQDPITFGFLEPSAEGSCGLLAAACFHLKLRQIFFTKTNLPYDER